MHTYYSELNDLSDRHEKKRSAQKWSTRRTVLFCLIACGTFWLVAGWALTPLF